MGSTVQCCVPGCSRSFHLNCLWSVGGEMMVKDSGKHYCANGLNPYIEARCVEHQLVGMTEACEV